MLHRALLTSSLAFGLVLIAPACAGVVAEGEGEGSASEGEGGASEGEGSAGEGEGSAGEGEGEGAVTTWYKDVLPLARQRCELCHVEGGIGPFSIEDEGAVVIEQDSITERVADGLMPPWMPGKDCSGHTYVGDRSLTDSEKAVFASWQASNFALGDVADASGSVPTLGALDRVDVTLVPSQSYTPDASAGDDYHCFLLDPALASRKFVTGFDVQPGTATMVHHVLLYAVDRAQAEAKQAQDRSVFGWTCFGGPDVDTSGSQSAPGVLGAWAPGTSATLYPADTGVALEPSQVVVMQVHYNFQAQPVPTADVTTAKLRLDDAVGTQAQLFPLANTDFTVQPNTTTTDSKAFPTFGLRVWGLLPHMHQLGTHISVSSSAHGCLVDIPAWDFHWQQSYFFSDVPNVDMAQTEQITVTCTWDNPTSNTLTWGESTSDEMCLAFAYGTL